MDFYDINSLLSVEREFLQRTIDFIHYLGDEMEMGRLPARDTVDAVRMIARLLSLQRQLI